MTEENHRKESLPEAVVFQEGEIKKRAAIAEKESVRIRREIIDISPYVNITKLHRDANFAKSAYSGTRETKGPSQRVVQKCEPHESSCAKIRGTQEETLQQERYARREAWDFFSNGWRTSQRTSRSCKCEYAHTFLMTQIRNVLQKWYR